MVLLQLIFLFQGFWFQVALTGGFFCVPLVHEPDHAGSPVLHLRVLDLTAVGESLPEDLPVAVRGKIPDHHGVGAGPDPHKFSI